MRRTMGFEMKIDYLIARRLDRVIVKKNPKTMEDEGDGNTNCNWCARNNPQRIGTETERLGNKRRSQGNLECSIKISQDTEKSPGDLRRLAVTEIPVVNHPLSLM